MIKIDDTYFIDVDSLCYTAKRKQPGKNKKGEDIMTEITIGYYGSVSASIRAILDDCMKRKLSEKEYSLREALRVIKDTSDNFEQMLKEAVNEDIRRGEK